MFFLWKDKSFLVQDESRNLKMRVEIFTFGTFERRDFHRVFISLFFQRRDFFEVENRWKMGKNFVREVKI